MKQGLGSCATCPGAACQPPPAHPCPDAQGQSSRASLKQRAQKAEGGVQTAAQQLRGENSEGPRGKGGPANPKINAREAGAGHRGGEMASSAFPQEPSPLRCPRAPGPGARLTPQEGLRAENKIAEHVEPPETLGSFAPPLTAAENLRSLRIQNPSILQNPCC